MEAPCDVGFGFVEADGGSNAVFFCTHGISGVQRNMQWVFGMQIDHIDNRLAVTAECVYASGNTELITAYNNEDCCVIWHRDKWCFLTLVLRAYLRTYVM